MITVKIITPEKTSIIKSTAGLPLLDILRNNGVDVHAPCGGKGTCGKCTVKITGEGDVLSCKYFPDRDIEVILPGRVEANILTRQTEFLEDMAFSIGSGSHFTARPVGAAIDIGTTTVVIYFLNLLTGQIEKISSFLNPQKVYGADVITRICYCQEQENGLSELRKSIVDSINHEFDIFIMQKRMKPENLEKVIIAGNTTMLHVFLGEDPVSIALAPFTPRFTGKQTRSGYSAGLKINADAEVVTLPVISAFVGADIVAGLSALKDIYRNYLFIDIGTNGEIAVVMDGRILVCATAAGPAFEGANISCGMAAVCGAVSGFPDRENMEVIGNCKPAGICGSGIVDVVAYLLRTGLIDETGFLKEPFLIESDMNIEVNQQDIREIQLAKSAIYSGIKILMKKAGLSFGDIDALFLAGGFGNYINTRSATEIGLLPIELGNRIYPVGNSAGIGALQFLKSNAFEKKINSTVEKAQYVELSNVDEFPLEFALNMNF